MGLGVSSFKGLSADQGIQVISEHLRQRGMTLQDAFTWCDRDLSGEITWEEFYQAVELCVEHVSGEAPDVEALGAIFHRFDENRDGRLSLAELASAVEKVDRTERLAHSVLERVASALVRLGFSPQDLFHRMDRDKNGLLQQSEIEEVICSLQPDLTVSERQAIWASFDADKSGNVDLNEFARRVEAVNAAPLVALEDKIGSLQRTFTEQGYGTYQVFAAFDANQDGHLHIEEWREAMASLAPNLSREDVDAIFGRFDENDDGYLSLVEFTQFFQDAIDRRPELAQADDGWPVFAPPPPEAPWEADLLDMIRESFSMGRAGMGITEVFRRLDIDNSNTMTREEFDRMALTYNANLGPEHLESLFRKVNLSGSGQISINEFIRRFG